MAESKSENGDPAGNAQRDARRRMGS